MRRSGSASLPKWRRRWDSATDGDAVPARVVEDGGVKDADR
jgi:hypothetical protein